MRIFKKQKRSKNYSIKLEFLGHLPVLDGRVKLFGLIIQC